MGKHTNISYCHHTFSPWWGCQKVGPGCDHCYAEVVDKGAGGGHWGAGAPRRRVAARTWKEPLHWNKEAEAAGERRRVLTSMCDPFDNAVDPDWRRDHFDLIRATPGLDWLLWTKRIGNVPAMLPADWGDGLPNVLLGISIVNQAEADRDIPKLLAVPAARRVLSIEPMLAPIDLRGRLTHCPTHDFAAGFCLGACPDRRSISWVICGGESGRGCRPMEPGWAYSLRDQCAAAGVPFYMKQMGGERPGVMPPIPADLLVQEYPA